MTDMLDDPAAMAPSQRRREIAAILARRVLRLLQCRENTRRLAAAPFNWDASIRFADSPIEAHEPTT